MYQEEKHVAYHPRTELVLLDATDGQNTALRTVPLFFPPNRPSESITLKGVHDFSAGSKTGSLSALSIASRCRLASDSCGLARH